MKKQEPSKGKKIVKGIVKGAGCLAVASIIGYVIKEVKDEYDDTIEENNRLRAFINEHDFYEKRKTNIVSSNYKSSEDTKFDPNNPIYKQSAATMKKLGLNPDGTMKEKPEFIKVDEYISSDGYIVEIKEDIVSGLQIHQTTNRKADESKEG